MNNFESWLSEKDPELYNEISKQNAALLAGLTLGTGSLADKVGMGADDVANRLAKAPPSDIAQKVIQKNKARQQAQDVRRAHGDSEESIEDPRDPRNQDPKIAQATQDYAKMMKDDYARLMKYRAEKEGEQASRNPNNPYSGFDFLSRQVNRRGNY